MKKILLGLMSLAIILSTSAYAQEVKTISKGTKTITADLSALNFELGLGESVDNYRLGVGVAGSYFVIDNMAAVVGLGYTLNSVAGTQVSNFNMSVGVRPYFKGQYFAGVYYEPFYNYGGDKKIDHSVRVDVGFIHYLAKSVFISPSIFYRKGFGNFDISKIGANVGIGVKF